MNIPYTGYGKWNSLLNELDKLKETAQARANALNNTGIVRTRAQACADTYAYCILRLTTEI